MRIQRYAAIAALLLTPSVVSAQTGTTGTTATTGTTTGLVDVGVRGTSTTGDAARYERYRDMGDGLFAEALRVKRVSGPWRFDFMAEHLSRKDQRILGRAVNQGKVSFWFQWDQIPMLLSTTTRTFFEGDVLNNQGILTIPDAIQLAGQANANNLPGLFVPGNYQEFTTKTRRHVAEAGVNFLATQDLHVRALFKNTDREGAIPFGGSFGHSQVVETLAPTNHQLRDVDASAEWARDRYLVRAGYTGSWFNNDVTSLTFDNPWRLTDTASASSRGRLTLPPSNSFVGVNGMASVKLPWRSRATAYVSTGVLKDAGDLMVANSANTITTGQTALARNTVDGEANTTSYNLSFTSRPKPQADFSVRLRSYDYDNLTPEFAMTQRVAYDNAVSLVNPPIHTEPFAVTRHTFDADARYLPRVGTSLGVGFSRLAEDRNHRIFEKTVENVFRLTFDTIGNQWFTVRSRYEQSEKRGEGFDVEILTSVSEQPGMRHFDLASRDRKRVTLIGVLTPVNNLLVNVSVAAGNDDYLESLMGLRDNNHRVYSVGFDSTPREKVAFGLSYSREKYLALSRSRQASPNSPAGCTNVFPAPAGQTTCQFYDETRNWAVDSNDAAHSFIVNADFTELLDKLDVNLSWDLNRSKATYKYLTGPVAGRTLPEETPDVGSTLTAPVQLPDVISNLNRGTVDVVYKLTARLGLGFSYWYEKYEVEDFALDAESTRDLVRSNAVLLGYLYRPYTAQTGWVRLIVKW